MLNGTLRQTIHGNNFMVHTKGSNQSISPIFNARYLEVSVTPDGLRAGRGLNQEVTLVLS